MCDEDTERDNDAFFTRNPEMTRRQFNKLAAGATIAAGTGLGLMLPEVAGAAEVQSRDVVIETPDGMADCYFVYPAQGKHPGVVIWPDILGLRPAFRMMGERLAKSGYAVLVVNPFYRGAKAPVIPEGASFQDPSVREIVYPLARALSAETHKTDARAFVGWLDKQAEVDTARKIGTTGYCMGGPIVFRTAATIPDRVGAAATFHGGGLVTDKPDSPHLSIPAMKASFLVAIAGNDDEREPDAKNTLRQSFEDAGLAAEVEVYEGTLHGWCPPDSRVYNEAQAEHAWTRLLALFGKALV